MFFFEATAFVKAFGFGVLWFSFSQTQFSKYLKSFSYLFNNDFLINEYKELLERLEIAKLDSTQLLKMIQAKMADNCSKNEAQNIIHFQDNQDKVRAKFKWVNFLRKSAKIIWIWRTSKLYLVSIALKVGTYKKKLPSESQII